MTANAILAVDSLGGIGVDLLTPLLRLVALLAIPLIIVSVALMVRSVGRARRITQRSLLIQICTSPAILLVYVVFLGVSIAIQWAIPIALLGMGVGGLWAQSTVLSMRGSSVFGTRSVWYILLWGGSFIITQTLAVFASSGLIAGGLATMCFTTGVAVGTNASLLLRRHQLLAQAEEGLA